MEKSTRKRTLIDSAKLIGLKLIRLDAPTEQIARGIALGCLVTSIPTFGFATPIATLLAPLVRANVIAATLSALFIGLLPAPTVFAVIGGVILGITPQEIIALLKNFNLHTLQTVGLDVFWRLL
jgi:uncharacterized protein (DUF2062 family)